MTANHAHRRDRRAIVWTAVQVVGEGAVFLVAMTSWLVLLWLLAK